MIEFLHISTFNTNKRGMKYFPTFVKNDIFIKLSLAFKTLRYTKPTPAVPEK